MYSEYVTKRLAEVAAKYELKALAGRERRGVMKETTRHGKTVFYYRQGKSPRIRLPDPDVVGRPAFNQAYAAAVRGENPSGVTASLRARIPRTASQSGKSGFVYFLRMGDAVKIGFSGSLGQRIKTIQTACPRPTEILCIIPGNYGTERYFHAHFAAHKLQGEWFRLDGQLAAFLANATTPTEG